jgi:hypothetical protein
MARKKTIDLLNETTTISGTDVYIIDKPNGTFKITHENVKRDILGTFNSSDISYISGIVDTNTDSINTVSGDLDIVEQYIVGEVSTINADIIAVSGKVNTNTADIIAVSGKVNTNTADIIAVSGKVVSVTTTVSENSAKWESGAIDYSTKINELSTDIIAVSGKVNTNTADIIAVSADIVSVTTTVSENSASWAGGGADYSTEINELSTDIIAVSGNVNTNTADIIAVSGKVNTNTADIIAVSADIIAVSADIIAVSGKVNTNTADIISVSGNVGNITTTISENSASWSDGAGFGLTTDPATLVADDDGTILVAQVYDPADPYTDLLLQFDTTLADSMGKHIVTAHGNAAVVTDVVSPFGSTGGVLYLDGSSYLTVPDSDDWYVGSGDFTVDCWVRPITTAETVIFYQGNPPYQGNDTNNKMFFSHVGASENVLLFAIAVSGTVSAWKASYTLTTGQWYHIELARSGSTVYMFVNGVAVDVWLAAGSASAIAANFTMPLFIGYRPDTALYTNTYIDEFRWSNGIVRHTEAFTPQSVPYEDGNTAGVLKRYNPDPAGMKISSLQATIDQVNTNTADIISVSGDIATVSGDVLNNITDIATISGNVNTNTADIIAVSADIVSVTTTVSENSASWAGGGGGVEVNTETLSGHKTIADGDPTIQLLTPNGANRNVLLPATPAADCEFVIVNAGAHTIESYLEVKLDGDSNYFTWLYAHATARVAFDLVSGRWTCYGPGWQRTRTGANTYVGGEATEIGYNADGSSAGAAVGQYANGSNYGAAVGNAANGSSGAAVGYQANGSSGAAVGYQANGSSGAAVGHQANGSDYGAAVGQNADGSNYGAAVGQYADGSNNGAAVGSDSNGSNGAAVGQYANGSSIGAAVGNSANGSGQGAAVGNAANGSNNGAAVGYYANNNSKGFGSAIAAYSRQERYGGHARTGDHWDTSKQHTEDVQWKGQTTNATATEIFLHGESANRCTVLASSVIGFTVRVVGINSTTFATYDIEIKGTIKRDASNNTTLVSATSQLFSDEMSLGISAVIVEADDVNEALIVKVTGLASNTIMWGAEGKLLDRRI